MVNKKCLCVGAGAASSMKKIASLLSGSPHPPSPPPDRPSLAHTHSDDIADLTNRLAFSAPHTSSSGVSRADIEALFTLYTEPIVRNFSILIEGTQFILDFLEHTSDKGTSEAGGSQRGVFEHNLDDDDSDGTGLVRARHGSYIRKEEEVRVERSDMC